MCFRQEYRLEWKADIDCYWESSKSEPETTNVYPSLPEPYVNLFFPVGTNDAPRIKGISSRADFLDVTTALFGIRLNLAGVFRLGLTPVRSHSDSLVSFYGVCPDEASRDLARAVAQANGFAERLALFESWSACRDRRLSNKESDISEAFRFLVANYRDPGVVGLIAERSGFSSRTISRWFSDVIGIGPKKMTRIARFHSTLAGIHSDPDPGFYLDCGYFDQAHFIREFKEFTGITPKKYLGLIRALNR